MSPLLSLAYLIILQWGWCLFPILIWCHLGCTRAHSNVFSSLIMDHPFSVGALLDGRQACLVCLRFLVLSCRLNTYRTAWHFSPNSSNVNCFPLCCGNLHIYFLVRYIRIVFIRFGFFEMKFIAISVSPQGLLLKKFFWCKSPGWSALPVQRCLGEVVQVEEVRREPELLSDYWITHRVRQNTWQPSRRGYLASFKSC